MKKLAIIGAAGGIGSSMAFHLGLSGLFDEMLLLDRKDNVLQSHIIDLRECFSQTGGPKVYGGSPLDLAGTDLVIITAAAPPFKVKSRSDYLAASLGIIEEVACQLKEFCPGAIIINASAPVDVFTKILHKIIGVERQKIMGFSLNDSWRFAWAVADTLKVDGRRVRALVLGEHGETQVPLYSQLLLDGQPLKLQAQEKERVENLLKEWYPTWQALDPGRTTTWMSAASMLNLVKNILTPQANRQLLPSSIILEGEYGFHDVALALPLLYNSSGWSQIIELDLDDDEKNKLKISAEKIYELGQSYLK